MRVSLLSYNMPELKGTQTGVFSKIPRHEVTHDQRYFETSYKRSYDKVDEVQNLNSHSKLDKFAGWETGFLKPEKIKITTKLIAEKYNTGTDNKFNSSIQRTWIGYKDPGMKAVEDYKIDNTKELILPPIDNELSLNLGNNKNFEANHNKTYNGCPRIKSDITFSTNKVQNLRK